MNASFYLNSGVLNHKLVSLNLPLRLMEDGVKKGKVCENIPRVVDWQKVDKIKSFKVSPSERYDWYRVEYGKYFINIISRKKKEERELMFAMISECSFVLKLLYDGGTPVVFMAKAKNSAVELDEMYLASMNKIIPLESTHQGKFAGLENVALETGALRVKTSFYDVDTGELLN